jgi:hypothetical protein
MFVGYVPIIGMRDVLLGLLLMRALVMDELVVRFGLFRLRGDGSLDDGRNRRIERSLHGRHCGDRLMMVFIMVVLFVVMLFMMIVIVVVMIIVRIVVVRFVIMRLVAMIVVVMVRVERMMPGFGVSFALMGMLMLAGRHALGGLRLDRLDHSALDPIAVAAAAGVAVTGAAAVPAILGLFLGFPMGLLFGLDQCLTVGDRDLVIVGMDFAEGQEAMAIAAIFNEGGLKGGFYPRDLGEVDIPAQLLALGGFEIKLFDSIATDHDDPGLFRVGGIDQHLVRHFGTLDGGGRVGPRALDALSADATVHLIRG